MSRIGILTLYATGHLNPSLTLARALQSAGHDPVFFNIPDTGAAISAAGIRFVPFAHEEYPLGSLKPTMAKIAELSGPAAFAYYVERMVKLFRASFAYIPELIRSEQLDLLIVDQVLYCGATIAEHVGLPFLSLANALLVNREPLIPPPVMLWPFDDSPAAIERNQKGWAAVDAAYAHLLPVVNEQRAAWNLTAYANLVEDSFSSLAQLVQQPPAFDFPRVEAPATLHFIGHLQDNHLSKEVPFPWEWLDGRPLVYASCGTLQNRLEHVFRAIIEACASLDAQTVVALGKEALSPDSFGDVPDNIKLIPYVPQRLLLERATLCIHHAGLNTTLDCLETGVPAVAIPIASEQPGIAMRLAYIGAGTYVPLSDLNAETLSSAIHKVLSTPSYRESAQSISQALAKQNPEREAVRIIEQTLASAKLPAKEKE